VADAQLVFANCEYYNEDDSEVVFTHHFIPLFTLLVFVDWESGPPDESIL